MTEQSARWYAYVANATKELTDEVRAMCTAHSTPIEYGLRIKSSPDTLMITARNKMGSGTAIKPAKVRLDGAFVETTAFDRDPETLSYNEKLAQNFLKELQAQHCYPDKNYSTDCGKPSGKLIRCVPSNLIRDYIRRYRNSSGSPKTNSEYLLRHINLLDERGHDDWDVFVTAGRKSETHASFTAFGDTTIRERRAPGRGTNETVFMFRGCAFPAEAWKRSSSTMRRSRKRKNNSTRKILIRKTSQMSTIAGFPDVDRC